MSTSPFSSLIDSQIFPPPPPIWLSTLKDTDFIALNSTRNTKKKWLQQFVSDKSRSRPEGGHFRSNASERLLSSAGKNRRAVREVEWEEKIERESDTEREKWWEHIGMWDICLEKRQCWAGSDVIRWNPLLEPLLDRGPAVCHSTEWFTCHTQSLWSHLWVLLYHRIGTYHWFPHREWKYDYQRVTSLTQYWNFSRKSRAG